MKRKTHCKKKQNRLARIMRNNGKPAVSEAFRTLNNSPTKNFDDVMSRNDRGQDVTYASKRDCFSKSPVDFNTLNVTESNKISLKPIIPV